MRTREKKSSLRKRLTFLSTSLAFSITIFTLFSLLLALSIDKYYEERDELEHIARSFEAIIQNTQADAIMTDKFYGIINEKSDLIGENFEHSYTVYNSVGDVIFQYPEDSDHLKILRETLSNGSPQGVKKISYNDWLFYHSIKDSEFSLTVTSRHQIDFINSILWTSLLLSPFILLLCFIAARFFSRQIQFHFDRIASAATEIASGELSARITPDSKSNDELEELVQKLNHTFSQLEHSIQQMSQFSSDAAHELRTPLTSLLGNLEVCLSREREIEEYQVTMSQTIDQILALKKVVDTLLLLAKPGQNFYEHFEKCELKKLILDCKETMDFLAEEKGISIKSELEREIHVKGVPTLLMRAVSNLLHNSIKFSQFSSEILIRCYKDGEKAIIEVEDQGHGIPVGDQEKVFERFFQSDSSKHQGTGLGLPLIKWTTEIHGGHIELESEENKGSKFTLTFPLAQNL